MKSRTSWTGLVGFIGLIGAAAAVGLTPGCTILNPDFCDQNTGVCPGDLADPSLVDLAGLEPGDVDLKGAPLDLGRDMVADSGGSPDLPLPSFDPDSAGPEKTVSFDLQIPVGRNNVSVTVIGPSDDGKEITRRAAPHPLVIISPGFTVDRKQYASYGTRLATYGMVAVLQKSTREFSHSMYRDETVGLIDWFATPTGANAGRVSGRVDLDRLGMAGHSLGGKISILVAAQDSRVKALLGLDPVDANTPPALPEISKIKLPAGIPMAFLGETTSKTGGAMPCTPAAGNYEALYAKAGAPAFAITLVAAAHNDFVDNFAMCPTCNFCPGGTAPKDRTNRLAVKYTAAYFLWALTGDARARDYFAGAAFQKDITDGYITRVSK